MAPSQKRDHYFRILTKVLTCHASKVLGTVTPGPRMQDGTSAEVASRWDQLVDHVGRALKKDIRAYTESPATLTDSELISHKAFFATVGVHLPSDKPGWTRWFERRDAHKADALYDEAKLRLSDRLAIEDPKQFYRQLTKPTSSAQIRALHTPDGIATSDTDIEHHLTEYLRHIGEKPHDEEMCPEAEHPPPSTSETWRKKRA